MEEVNPLLIPTIVSESKSSNNKRGRPTIEETIKFNAQPKSLIISQILSKRATSCNVDIDQHLTQPESEDNNSLHAADSPQSSEQTLLNENVNNIEIGRCRAIKEEKDHSDINSHLNDKLHYCNYPNCAYTCKLSCNLIKHKRTHTDEKPYLCDQCTFRSNFVNSLKVHKRIHTSERPHGCKHCTYRCNSSSNLKKHYLHRHPEVSKT